MYPDVPHFALVDANGTPRGVVQMLAGQGVEDGALAEGSDLIYYQIPDGVEPVEVLEQWVFRNGWQNYGLAPTPFHNLTAEGWVPDLPRAKAAKVAEINEWMTAQRQFFDWNGHRWDSHAEGRANIMGVVIAGIAPPSGYWTSAANVDVPVTTVEAMQSMYQAMLLKADAVHNRQRQMKQDVASLATVEAILGYFVGWGE